MIDPFEILGAIRPTRRGFLQGTASAAASPMLPPGTAPPAFGAEQFLELLQKARDIDQVTKDDWPFDTLFYDLNKLTQKQFQNQYSPEHVRARLLPYIDLMREAPPEISNYMQHGATAYNLEEMVREHSPWISEEPKTFYGKDWTTGGHEAQGLYRTLRRYHSDRENMTPDEISAMKAELDQRMPAMLEWAAKQTGARFNGIPKLDVNNLYKLFDAVKPSNDMGHPGQEPHIPQGTSLPPQQVIELLMELYDHSHRRKVQPDIGELLNSPDLPNLLGEG